MEYIKTGEADGYIILRSQTGETAAFEFLEMTVVNGREYAALLQRGDTLLTVLRLLEDGEQERYGEISDDAEFEAALSAFADLFEDDA